MCARVLGDPVIEAYCMLDTSMSGADAQVVVSATMSVVVATLPQGVLQHEF
jgi:hypothetical protein